jgi:hypothetical protein
MFSKLVAFYEELVLYCGYVGYKWSFLINWTDCGDKSCVNLMIYMDTYFPDKVNLRTSMQ